MACAKVRRCTCDEACVGVGGLGGGVGNGMTQGCSGRGGKFRLSFLEVPAYPLGA